MPWPEARDGIEASLSAVPAPRWLRAAERLLAVLLTLVAVGLHAVFLVEAGGPWRDEVNCLSLALRPSLAETWSASRFDSFPVLYLLVVRAWAGLFGATDPSVRALGFTVGILVVAALWGAARVVGRRAPLLSLLLIGMSPVAVRALDSIRPHGIAAVTTILAFAAVWRAVQRPDPARIAMATVALILAVHSLYQAAVFAAALGVAAVSVSFLRGGVRPALILTVPFGVAASSLLPYAGHLQAARAWAPVAANPSAGNLLWPAFLDALRSPAPGLMWVWGAAATLAVVGAVRGLSSHGSGKPGEHGQERRGLYCAITLVASAAGFVAFAVYVAGSIAWQPWHVVPVLVVAAVSLEPLVERATGRGGWRACWLAVILVGAVSLPVPAARSLAMRMTSMDLVASVIGRDAEAGDLIVVNPWYLGVSFGRYYRGRAPWTTLPHLEDTAVHRYDLLKARLEQPQAVSDDLAGIAAVLARGARVWVVGRLDTGGPGAPIASLPAPPLPATGWSSGPYLLNWSLRLTWTLAANSRQAEVIPIHADWMINPLESPTVVVFQGRGP